MAKIYHYTECGLDDVYLLNGFTIEHDDEYGELVFIEDVDRLHKTLARRLIDSARTLNGAEFRYLRVFLDLSQKRLGEFLRQKEQNIGNWERNRQKPVANETADLLLRAFAAERLNGHSKVGTLIEKLADADAHNAGQLRFERDPQSQAWKAVA